MILVDTAIWIDHIHRSNRELAALLEAQQVLTHPFIIGELACGSMKCRDAFLADLAVLPRVTVATDPEVLALIENHELMGRGLNYVDVHLLASALIHAGTRFWTQDRRLASVAVSLEIPVFGRG